MTGKEKFTFDSKNLDYDFSDFWRFHFSNIYALQDKIALCDKIEKALKIKQTELASLMLKVK